MSDDIRAEAVKYYDVNPTIPDDIAFYQARLPSSDASVLELGCGTGRVLLPLAAVCGFIHGMDRSQAISIQRGTSCIRSWSIAATSEARGSRTRCCTSPGGVTRPTNSSRSSSITTSGLSSVGVGMPGSAMGRDRSSWSSSAGHATKKSWTPAALLLQQLEEALLCSRDGPL